MASAAHDYQPTSCRPSATISARTRTSASTDRVANSFTPTGLAAAAKVQCPVHCVLGTRDQMTLPKQAQAITAALHATVHRLPAGHSLMSELPDDVLNVLRQVLTEKEIPA